MRGKRSKQYRKLMQQYGLHFGFREPYQVLLDADILKDAARFKMDFLGGLEKALHGAVKPLITQCSMRHLYNAEPKDDIVIEHAKGFERRRCNHHNLEKPLSTFECLSEVLDSKGAGTNKHRYVVATQDERLRAFFRRIPGVPMIYLKRSVMIMEPMASVTEDVRQREERSKFRLGLKSKRGSGATAVQTRPNGAENVTEGDGSPITNEKKLTDSESMLPKPKRKRGPSNPNPLSVKKPKKKPASSGMGAVNAMKSKPMPPLDMARRDTEAVAASKDHRNVRRKRSRKPQISDAGSAKINADHSSP